MKGLDGDQWNLVLVKIVTMEPFWDWVKMDAINVVGDLFTGPEH